MSENTRSPANTLWNEYESGPLTWTIRHVLDTATLPSTVEFTLAVWGFIRIGSSPSGFRVVSRDTEHPMASRRHQEIPPMQQVTDGRDLANLVSGRPDHDLRDYPRRLDAILRQVDSELDIWDQASDARPDMGGILSSGQGEAAAATVVVAAASLTG